MARQLWLLRHADAEPHGTRSDFERRLTERGERQSKVAGETFARLRVEFDAILSSPKERALRTATLALAAWEERAEPPSSAPSGLTVHEPLSAGFDGRLAFAALADLGPRARLLVVGHEPDLSSVVAELTGAQIDLKKGGLAVVRLSAPAGRAPSPSAHAAGELTLLLRPSELALIAAAAAPVEL